MLQNLYIHTKQEQKISQLLINCQFSESMIAKYQIATPL